MKPLRILLVDDHEVVRLGLKTLLSEHPRFEVIAEAASADEAVASAKLHKPHIVVMDVRMPGRSGIEATREITLALPQTEVIVLTSYADNQLLFDAIQAGASGYILKQIAPVNLIQALESVARGQALLDPRVTRAVFDRVRAAEREAVGNRFSALTTQELRVLSLITTGQSNHQIALRLHLSNGTVRNYVSNLIQKLGVRNRVEAAAFAVRHHLDSYLPRPPG